MMAPYDETILSPRKSDSAIIVGRQDTALSEMMCQLTTLKDTNRKKDDKIGQLERKLMIMSDMKRVSVSDLRQPVEMEELRNQVANLQTQLHQIVSSISAVPTSRVEVLETLAEHQATQIDTLQQENERLWSQISQLQLKMRKRPYNGDEDDNSSHDMDDDALFYEVEGASGLNGDDISPSSDIMADFPDDELRHDSESASWNGSQDFGFPEGPAALSRRRRRRGQDVVSGIDTTSFDKDLLLGTFNGGSGGAVMPTPSFGDATTNRRGRRQFNPQYSPRRFDFIAEEEAYNATTTTTTTTTTRTTSSSRGSRTMMIGLPASSMAFSASERNTSPNRTSRKSFREQMLIASSERRMGGTNGAEALLSQAAFSSSTASRRAHENSSGFSLPRLDRVLSLWQWDRDLKLGKMDDIDDDQIRMAKETLQELFAVLPDKEDTVVLKRKPLLLLPPPEETSSTARDLLLGVRPSQAQDGEDDRFSHLNKSIVVDVTDQDALLGLGDESGYSDHKRSESDARQSWPEKSSTEEDEEARKEECEDAQSQSSSLSPISVSISAKLSKISDNSKRFLKESSERFVKDVASPIKVISFRAVDKTVDRVFPLLKLDGLVKQEDEDDDDILGQDLTSQMSSFDDTHYETRDQDASIAGSSMMSRTTASSAFVRASRRLLKRSSDVLSKEVAPKLNMAVDETVDRVFPLLKLSSRDEEQMMTPVQEEKTKEFLQQMDFMF